MVAGRACGAEHATFAGRQPGCSAHGGVGARLGRRPGAGRQRRAVVHRIQPQAGGEIGGLPIAAQGAHRPDRWKRLAIGIGAVQRQPVGPGAFQERQITRRMDPVQDGAGVQVWRTQRMATRQQRLLHKRSPRRGFEARHALSPEKLEFRRVQDLLLRKKRDHGKGSAAAGAWAKRATYRRRGSVCSNRSTSERRCACNCAKPACISSVASSM